jgi:hypothetical protein
MLYTLVDPHVGHEVAYNRWYERDHYYEGCMVGPHLFAGSRWVATREMKDMRFPVGRGEICDPTDKGSYVAIYWVQEGKHDEHFGWGLTKVQWIYQNDRGFQERTHAHTVLYEEPWSFYRDDDPVPIELALDHRYPALASVALDRAEGVSVEDLNAFLTGTALPALMGADSKVASMVSWVPVIREDDLTDGAPMDLGTKGGGHERSHQLFFLEDDPKAVWDQFHAYADAVNASGLAEVVFAGPFLATSVGTDKYTDQLW